MPCLSHTFPFLPQNIPSFWQSLHKNPRHGFILGSGAASREDHVVYMSCEEPVKIFRSRGDEGGDPLRQLEKAIKRSPQHDGPETCGDDGGCDSPRFVGVLGYEAGRHFDSGIRRQPRRPHPMKTPVSLFGEYHSVVVLDTRRQQMTLTVMGKNAIHRFRNIAGRIALAYNTIPRKTKASSFSKKFHFLSYPEFAKRVNMAKEAIREGDIYQANLIDFDNYLTPIIQLILSYYYLLRITFVTNNVLPHLQLFLLNQHLVTHLD